MGLNDHPKKTFHPNVIEALQAYTWPGNVRELKNMVERLLIWSRSATATLVRSSVYALLSTLALVGVLWLIGRFSRRLRSRIRRSSWLDSLRLQKLQIVTPERLMRTASQLILVFRVLATILVLDMYLTYVLGLFPWTRAASLQLFDYLLAPLSVAGTAFLSYLPKLLFVLFIALVIYLAIRRGGFLFRDPEWPACLSGFSTGVG